MKTDYKIGQKVVCKTSRLTNLKRPILKHDILYIYAEMARGGYQVTDGFKYIGIVRRSDIKEF